MCCIEVALVLFAPIYVGKYDIYIIFFLVSEIRVFLLVSDPTF